MTKKRRSKTWIWVLLVICLAALLGLYFYLKERPIAWQPAQEGPPLGQKEKPLSPTITPPPQEVKPKIPVKPEGLPAQPPLQPSPLAQESKLHYCQQLESDVAEFFRYLDNKDYIRHLDLGKPTLEYCKTVIKRLTKYAPIPAGEGVDPKLLTRNIYHFYRALGRKDLRLLREILQNETDTMEINLEIFYRWAMAGDRCPDNLGLRPPFEVLYKYAGFLLNTIGGRAYLLRRSPPLRLVLTYYCLLIVHEADKRGKNNYGIDPFPFLLLLREEISHYPDLEFQSEYLQTLERIEGYYLQRR